jgi:hypothetical protein
MVVKKGMYTWYISCCTIKRVPDTSSKIRTHACKKTEKVKSESEIVISELDLGLELELGLETKKKNNKSNYINYNWNRPT